MGFGESEFAAPWSFASQQSLFANALSGFATLAAISHLIL